MSKYAKVIRYTVEVKCEYCGRLVVQKRSTRTKNGKTRTVKPVKNYCSNAHRIYLYKQDEMREQIRKGDFHNMNVANIEKLGFKVEVHEL